MVQVIAVIALVVNCISIILAIIAIYLLKRNGKFDDSVAGDSKYFQTHFIIGIVIYQSSIAGIQMLDIDNNAFNIVHGFRQIGTAVGALSGTGWMICLWHLFTDKLYNSLFKDCRRFLVQPGRLRLLYKCCMLIYIILTIIGVVLGSVNCQCDSSIAYTRIIASIWKLSSHFFCVPILIDLVQIIFKLKFSKDRLKSENQVKLQPLIIAWIVIFLLNVAAYWGTISTLRGIFIKAAPIRFTSVCGTSLETCSIVRPNGHSEIIDVLLYSPFGTFAAIPVLNKYYLQRRRSSASSPSSKLRSASQTAHSSHSHRQSGTSSNAGE